MAGKLQDITDVYQTDLKHLRNNPDAWTDFLSCACRNYKCSFDEQVLIHAQRPDATAVLEIERWNKQFKRWVNRGAKGIAVFDRNYVGNTRLKYYFDVSDTNSNDNRPMYIWSMQPEYESDVIETLQNSFGTLDENDNFANAIISAAKNIVDDNLSDYVEQVMSVRNESILDGLDESEVSMEMGEILRNSVAYMMLTRCGFQPDSYFSNEDFSNIVLFSTHNTMSVLGTAVSDIAEMGLREISSTVRNLKRKQNRTFANENQSTYNEVENDDERSSEHEQYNIHNGGRLSNSQPNSAGRNTDDFRQVRSTTSEISEKEQDGNIQRPVDVGQAERTPDGNRTGGNEPNEVISITDGESRGSSQWSRRIPLPALLPARRRLP